MRSIMHHLRVRFPQLRTYAFSLPASSSRIALGNPMARVFTRAIHLGTIGAGQYVGSGREDKRSGLIR